MILSKTYTGSMSHIKGHVKRVMGYSIFSRHERELHDEAAISGRERCYECICVPRHDEERDEGHSVLPGGVEYP